MPSLANFFYKRAGPEFTRTHRNRSMLFVLFASNLSKHPLILVSTFNILPQDSFRTELDLAATIYVPLAMKRNVGVDSSWHHTTGNFCTVARIFFGDWSVHHLFRAHNGNP